MKKLVAIALLPLFTFADFSDDVSTGLSSLNTKLENAYNNLKSNYQSTANALANNIDFQISADIGVNNWNKIKDDITTVYLQQKKLILSDLTEIKNSAEILKAQYGANVIGSGEYNSAVNDLTSKFTSTVSGYESNITSYVSGTTSRILSNSTTIGTGEKISQIKSKYSSLKPLVDSYLSTKKTVDSFNVHGLTTVKNDLVKQSTGIIYGYVDEFNQSYVKRFPTLAYLSGDISAYLESTKKEYLTNLNTYLENELKFLSSKENETLTEFGKIVTSVYQNGDYNFQKINELSDDYKNYSGALAQLAVKFGSGANSISYITSQVNQYNESQKKALNDKLTTYFSNQREFVSFRMVKEQTEIDELRTLVNGYSSAKDKKLHADAIVTKAQDLLNKLMDKSKTGIIEKYLWKGKYYQVDHQITSMGVSKYKRNRDAIKQRLKINKNYTTLRREAIKTKSMDEFIKKSQNTLETIDKTIAEKDDMTKYLYLETKKIIIRGVYLTSYKK